MRNFIKLIHSCLPAPPQVCNVFGKSLCAAARNEQHEMVRFLLIKGADANYSIYPRTEDDRRAVEANNRREDIERAGVAVGGIRR